MVACLLSFAVLTTVAAGGLTYLFTIPGIAVAVAMLIPQEHPMARQLLFAGVASVALILVAPAIDLFLQFAHPRPGNPDSSIPATVFVPLSLGLLTVRLLRAFWPTAAGTQRGKSL